MNQVRVNESSLVDIAEAIREKSGKSNTYTPSEMGDAVRELPTRIPVTESITITANGTYEAPAEIDGYSEVIAQVAPNNTTIEITSNGSYTTPAGYDGFSEVIVNTPTLPEEAFLITGDCSYMFYNGKWDWFIENYGNQITTQNITTSNNMFSNSNVTTIPFELNLIGSNFTMGTMFGYCGYLESIPKITGYCAPGDMKTIFTNCYRLRYLPEDIETWFDWSYMDNATTQYQGNRNSTLNSCYSLRSVPMSFLNHGNPVAAYTNSLHYSTFYNCFALDEIIDLPNPHYNATWTNNVFNVTFSNCNRLKNITFATPNGQPYVVNWKNQTIDLSKDVGYSTSIYNIYSYNSGITADKEVKDDASYQALKDDPDWFTGNIAYSRYNYESAVATINSLPDASAYLATAGGTNTIKFRREAGSKTDGGSFSTHTDEEIAALSAILKEKGWVLALV